MDQNDLNYIRASIEVARKAREKGNHPFGAILVDEQGEFLMEAENTVITDRDSTGHAETNLIRLATAKYDTDFLEKCTMYASTEPCPMCAAAIFWGNVGRVVYALSSSSFYKLLGDEYGDSLPITCREVFAKGNKNIEVIGPVHEEEAKEVHKDFWI